MADHLLNLRVLAGATLDDYALLSFEGREAISEPFYYQIEVVHVGGSEPDVSTWIGKHAEFDVRPANAAVRVFSGRIFGARVSSADGVLHVQLEIRPAYFALSYARATHFVQDKNSVDIFQAWTADALGLVKSVGVSGSPPVRANSVRFDETEIDYLARLLAQDGIFYFFKYDDAAGPFHHRMIVANSASDYVDVDAGSVKFLPNSTSSAITSLSRSYAAATKKHTAQSYNILQLDTVHAAEKDVGAAWSEVYSRGYAENGFETVAAAGMNLTGEAMGNNHAQAADVVHGGSTEPSFMAGGRVEIEGAGSLAPARIVFTSVTHSAHDPWMLPGAGTGGYSNHFTAIDATKVIRPVVNAPAPHAPGPMVAIVGNDSAKDGEIVVDKDGRIPVKIQNAIEHASLPKFVWLPVSQQWANQTHGAQFVPRIGAHVVIDFLYGNPDLPFVFSNLYSGTKKYPFDVTSKSTQTGWRSVTADSSAKIVQEFRFEDKPSSEEIYLYTGRDYRRMIDQDDWGTVKRDQTLEVQRDQKLTVTRDRTVKIDGAQKTDITKTQTVTVTQKYLHESLKEIELKVGPSSIKLSMQGIEIKAPMIKITADAKLDMSGGAMATLKAPIIQENADATMILKGGIVLIN